MSVKANLASFSENVHGFFEELGFFLKWGGVQTLVVMLVALGIAAFGFPQVAQLKGIDQLLFGLACLIISAIVSAAVAFKQQLDVSAGLWWLYAGAIVAATCYHFLGQLPAVLSAIVFVLITIFLFVQIRNINKPAAEEAGDGKTTKTTPNSQQDDTAAVAQASAALAVETAKGKLIDLGAVTETDVQARATLALAEAKRVLKEEREQALAEYQFALNHKDDYTTEEIAELKRRAHQFGNPKTVVVPRKEKKAGFREDRGFGFGEW